MYEVKAWVCAWIMRVCAIDWRHGNAPEPSERSWGTRERCLQVVGGSGAADEDVPLKEGGGWLHADRRVRLTRGKSVRSTKWL